MKKLAILCGVMLLFSVAAKAQDDSKFEVFGGYSFVRFYPNISGSGISGINFNGGVASIAYNLNPWFAAVGEVGAYHAGTINSNGVTTGAYSSAVSYLFGPKVYMSKGKFTPFGQVLLGGVHDNLTIPGSGGSLTTPQNALAVAFGGGLDWNATPFIGLRLGQIEYLLTRFGNSVSNGIGQGGTGNQNSFRYSAGITFRF